MDVNYAVNSLIGFDANSELLFSQINLGGSGPSLLDQGDRNKA